MIKDNTTQDALIHDSGTFVTSNSNIRDVKNRHKIPKTMTNHTCVFLKSAAFNATELFRDLQKFANS